MESVIPIFPAAIVGIDEIIRPMISLTRKWKHKNNRFGYIVIVSFLLLCATVPHNQAVPCHTHSFGWERAPAADGFGSVWRRWLQSSPHVYPPRQKVCRQQCG